MMRGEMSTNRAEPSHGSDARDSRRWLIGVGISLVFGLFSMVMALLSYSASTQPKAAPADNGSAARGSIEPAKVGKVRADHRK
jgi:hypothetical protein